MTFKPSYRDTPTQLKAEADQARDWFLEICRRVAATINDDEVKAVLDEEFQKIADAKWGETPTGWGNGERFVTGGFYCQDYGRDGGHYYWSNPSGGESANYKWEFEIGQSARSSYSRAKFVIRKDGSVNEENLKDAMWDWASKKVRETKSRNIHAANLEEYEQLQSPGKHDNFVTVELSRGKLGVAKLSYRNTWVKLGDVHDVPIKNIQRMIRLMMETAELFAVEAKDIRDDQ